VSARPGPLLDPDLAGAGPVDVLWLAGEHSGDQHAARVATRLAAERPDLRQVAIGGPALADAGVPLLFDLTESSVVGLVEVLRHYGFFRRLFGEVVEWIRTHRPRAVVLVDYPGFNLRLAEALQRAGLSRQAGGPVALYAYISPQVWAWKGHRRFKMARLLDELGVIFPFEVETFADTTLPVRFVGHPFLDQDYEPLVRHDPEGSLLLLPGSRLQAVRRIFPVMLDAVEAWRARAPDHRKVPLTALAPNAALGATLQDMLAARPLPVFVQWARQAVQARLVLTSSGTMSLDCALAGVPGAIVYRAHALTYFFGRRLVKVPYLGIANLILGRAMYPEFIQDAARPDALAEALESAQRPETLARVLADRDALHATLAAPASATPAARLVALLAESGPPAAEVGMS
jgi:lipid-A-disaccharide synthase